MPLLITRNRELLKVWIDSNFVVSNLKRFLELIAGASQKLGKDVVARAKTGSGKTLSYLLPLVHKLLAEGVSKKGPSAMVLVPTRELCQQVYDEATSLSEYCGATLRVVQLATTMTTANLKMALARVPDILVATPARIAACVSQNVLLPSVLQESLSMLVLDEADLLFSYGYEEDLRSLAVHVPRRCQCLL